MLQTYRGILRKDHIEWQDEPPPPHDQPINVHVTILDPLESEEETYQGDAIAASLQKLADLGGLSGIPDPVAWQREIRKDRPLPGREE